MKQAMRKIERKQYGQKDNKEDSNQCNGKDSNENVKDEEEDQQFFTKPLTAL